MEQLNEYLKELVDQGVIHCDVKDDILYMVENILIADKYKQRS